MGNPDSQTGRSTCSCSALTRGLRARRWGAARIPSCSCRWYRRQETSSCSLYPGDLFVEVEPGERDKINAAYNYGGVDETIDALENYSGVPVDHYAVVDFEGFERVIDAMGGVRVDVGDGQFPEKWRMGEDVQRLNGHKA